MFNYLHKVKELHLFSFIKRTKIEKINMQNFFYLDFSIEKQTIMNI